MEIGDPLGDYRQRISQTYVESHSDTSSGDDVEYDEDDEDDDDDRDADFSASASHGRAAGRRARQQVSPLLANGSSLQKL